jgi:5-keto 4-deoxyuronate isomerase
MLLRKSQQYVYYEFDRSAEIVHVLAIGTPQEMASAILSSRLG